MNIEPRTIVMTSTALIALTVGLLGACSGTEAGSPTSGDAGPPANSACRPGPSPDTCITDGNATCYAGAPGKAAACNPKNAASCANPSSQCFDFGGVPTCCARGIPTDGGPKLGAGTCQPGPVPNTCIDQGEGKTCYFGAEGKPLACGPNATCAVAGFDCYVVQDGVDCCSFCPTEWSASCGAQTKSQ